MDRVRGWIRSRPILAVAVGGIVAVLIGVVVGVAEGEGEADEGQVSELEGEIASLEAELEETYEIISEQAAEDLPDLDDEEEVVSDEPDIQDCTDLRAPEEGRCEAEGDRYVVVNRNSLLRLSELTARIIDIETTEVLEDLGDTSRAKGVYLIFTLEVKNRLNIPTEFDESGQIVYTSGEDPQNVYTPDSFVDWQRSLLSKDQIPPGLSETGTVVFDVPQRAVTDLERNGNLRLFNFSDASRSRARLLTGVFRTYEAG